MDLPQSSSSSPRRVLSIQSHVVSGYVGNKSATFPLQLLGYEVDVINSVHLSNHTGYSKGFKGQILQGAELLALIEGLTDNGLLTSETTHLLTGYIGSESFLRSVLDVISRLRAINPSLKYVCDPVLGDRGKLYVPFSLVEIYKKEVVPQAYMVTPNEFEVECLTGITIKNLDDACKACDELHALGPTLVVITSMAFASEPLSLTVLLSHKDGEKWHVVSPKIEGEYTGTGDLCAALLLAWEDDVSGAERQSASSSVGGGGGAADDDGPRGLGAVLERVTNTMYKVIERTRRDAGTGKELRLVQSKRDIEDGGRGGGLKAVKLKDGKRS